MKILSYIILAIFYVAQFPFSAAGYIATWIAAFWTFGVAKAEEHMDYTIALHDKRKQSNVANTEQNTPVSSDSAKDTNKQPEGEK